MFVRTIYTDSSGQLRGNKSRSSASVNDKIITIKNSFNNSLLGFRNKIKDLTCRH